jgi:hypothetical protein
VFSDPSSRTGPEITLLPHYSCTKNTVNLCTESTIDQDLNIVLHCHAWAGVALAGWTRLDINYTHVLLNQGGH